MSSSDLWNEDDKRAFSDFVNTLIRLKIFKLKKYNGYLSSTHVDLVTGALVARWQK